MASFARNQKDWFAAEFKSFEDLVAWFCGKIWPVRTKRGIVWVTHYRHQERIKTVGSGCAEFYVLDTGTWTGYAWDIDADPALALLQETFIKQQGFKV